MHLTMRQFQRKCQISALQEILKAFLKGARPGQRKALARASTEETGLITVSNKDLQGRFARSALINTPDNFKAGKNSSVH